MIPDKIQILNKDVSIKIVDQINGDSSTLGQWVGTERTIYLKKENPCMKETLLHELFEAIKDDCDMSKFDHQTLSTLSCILYDILTDYPEIFRNVKE